MMSFQDELKMLKKGELTLLRILPDGSRELAFEDNNQIQYVGAHKIARALVSSVYPMPVLSKMIVSTYDPVNAVPVGDPRGVPRSRANQTTPSNLTDPTFPVDLETTAFQAQHTTASNEPQIIVCKGVVMNTSLVHTTRFFQFGLLMTGQKPNTGQMENTILAYKYVPGGVSWGIATGMDIIWTLYIGA